MCRGWWLLYITLRSLEYNVNVTSLVCHNFHGVMGGCRATGMQTKDFKELRSNYAANLRCKQRWVQCILWLKCRLLPYFHCPVLAEERAMRQVSPQSVSNSLWALARQDLGMPGPTFFPTRIIIPNGFTASYAKYRPTFHNGYVRPVRHSRVHPSSPAMFIGLLLNEWGRVVGGRSKFAATVKVIEYSPRSILNPFDQWNLGLVSFSTQAFFYQDCVLAKLTMLICSSTVNPKFIGKLPSGYLT